MQNRKTKTIVGAVSYQHMTLAEKAAMRRFTGEVRRSRNTHKIVIGFLAGALLAILFACGWGLVASLSTVRAEQATYCEGVEPGGYNWTTCNIRGMLR